MNRFGRWLALGTAALLLQTAGAQTPEEHTYVVLDLQSPPVMRNIARRLSTNIAAEARRMGATVIDSRALAELIGQARVDDAEACAIDPACLSGALVGVEADRVIAGTLDRSRTAYEVRLIHADIGSGRLVSQVSRDVLIASRRLDRDVNDAVPDLLKGEPERTGTLVVETEVEGAEVRVDGEVVGRTPDLQVELQPGKHQVEVRAADHLPLDRFIEIRPGETTRFEARLLLEPGKEKPVVVGVPAAATAPEPEPESEPLVRLPLVSWLAGGAAVLAIGGGVALGLKASDIEDEAVDLDEDGILDISRERALEGRNAATGANVLYGLAGAAAITAVVFAVLDRDPAEAPGPEVGATLLPGGAAVVIGGTF